MKDLLRRLTRLESKRARDLSAQGGDHGLSPEEYAVAHAGLTRLLSTHLSEWPREMIVAVRDALPGDMWAKHGQPLDAYLATEPGDAP